MSGAAAAGARIGVFGGAFDPPHIAHIALVRAAIRQLRLDELRVLPTGAAWHKPRPLSAAAHRIEMARLAFAGLRGAIVDVRETRRGGPTYTEDTLRELQREAPAAALHLVIGADQAAALTRWHDWPALLDIATICVAGRAEPAGAAAVFSLENRPPELLAGRFLPIELPPLAVSSTEIRARVARGLDVSALVTAPVARYIAEHHLYQNKPLDEHH